MKNTLLVIPIAMLLTGCSGVAPEAVRDENNTLTKPPFMEKDQATSKKENEAV